MQGTDHLAQATKSLKTSSAVAPSLLLTVICTPLGMAASRLSPAPFDLIFAVIAIVPVVLTVIQIVYFTFREPDRLQNERHVEQKMLLSRIPPQMGDHSSVVELDSSQNLMVNPMMKDR